MPSLHELADALHLLDGRGYKSYKRIAGEYDAGAFRLLIDHVQGDPFAEPSRLRAIVPPESARLPDWSISNDARITATADFLNRALSDALRQASRRRGSGKSGELTVLRPRQEVLVRTSIIVSGDGTVEARFRAGMPANGRTILGREAAEMITRDVVDAVHAALFFDALDAAALKRHA